MITPGHSRQTAVFVRRRAENRAMGSVLARTAREVRDVFGAASPTHRRLRDHFLAIFVATVVVDVVCAALAFLLERNAQQTEIGTIGSALFWTTTQLLTVSSSFGNPISPGGRVLDIFMEAYAIIVIATLAGALGAFLQKRGREIESERH
jgi:hypothetical protein